MIVRRVWIEEGCISCNLCEDLCPSVFEVPAGGECRTAPGHRERLGEPGIDAKVREAAEACPVEVIRIEED